MTNHNPDLVFHVVYHCTASRPMTRGDLDAIERVSQCNNERDGISGMLIYGWHQFVQILEGPHANLLLTLGRIARDERCRGITLDAIEPIQTRSFASWSMNVVDLEAVGPDARHWMAEIMESLQFIENAELRAATVVEHLDRIRRRETSGAA